MEWRIGTSPTRECAKHARVRKNHLPREAATRVPRVASILVGCHFCTRSRDRSHDSDRSFAETRKYSKSSSKEQSFKNLFEIYFNLACKINFSSPGPFHTVQLHPVFRSYIPASFRPTPTETATVLDTCRSQICTGAV